jgi:hexosaminidase
VAATPIAVAASSVAVNEHSPASSVDSNLSTRWSSEFSDNQWLAVDLGEATAFDRIHILWEMARAAEYEIHTSLDGENWTTLRHVSTSGDRDDLADLDGYARFVRMQGLSRATSWGYSIYELEVYRNGENIAAGRPMTASSAERNEYPAAWAIDGDPTTRWSSDFTDEQWIAFDFGRIVPISRLVLNWETAFATEYEVQVSDDAVGWTTVRGVSDGDGGVDELSNLLALGRYVRLLLHRRGTPWGLSLWDVAVF